MITIGINPHKNSLTAVAVEPSSQSHPPLRVVMDKNTSASLLAWAKQWPDRQWAVEGATGNGHEEAAGLGDDVGAVEGGESPGRSGWKMAS